MIFLYSPKNYVGLDALALSLGATRLSRFDGEHFWDKPRKTRLTIPPGSIVISWGTFLPELDNLKILNAVERPQNKIEQMEVLNSLGVRAIRCYPENVNSPAAWESLPNKYIGRKFGENLSLTGEAVVNPDYYVDRMVFTKEFVVHSFDGFSIRAGDKTPIVGVYNHPTIRVPAGGWTTDYSIQSLPEVRAISHKAIKVLGLTFGMVEVGQTSDNKLCIINVSFAPELALVATVKAYTKAINKWIAKGGV